MGDQHPHWALLGTRHILALCGLQPGVSVTCGHDSCVIDLTL